MGHGDAGADPREPDDEPTRRVDAVSHTDTHVEFAPYMARWELTPDGAPVSTHSSRLLPVLHDGQPAMLKVALEDDEKTGGALIAWWDGRGAARVLAHDADAALLEWAAGSRSLSDMARDGQDEAASHVICDVVAALHAPRRTPAPRVVPLPVWFVPLEAAVSSTGGIFASAWATAGRLLAEPREIGVLHGDIHHDNILDFGDRGWLAIDPKGLWGERGYDYANLFRNPLEDLALRPGRFERQVSLVSERAGLEPTRLLRWIHAVMGLSAAWQIGEADLPGMPSQSTTLAIAAAALGEA